MSGEVRWCVVTGGRGFAARHLVEMLIKGETYSVVVADLGPKIELEQYEENGVLGEALRSGRARYVGADLRVKEQILEAFRGAEVVFHTAAPNSSINNYQLHHSVNVQGTKNVIDACVELKVKRLIYTSSPSVVFDGVHGILNGDESLPYATKHIDFYSATKAEGEALVIKSNGINGLLTCCIRPSSIFGPGDRLLVPSLVSAARAGKSKFIIGDGNNLYDFTYVENVVHGHICAERALASGGEVAAKASGQAYFITNMEPIKFWEFVSLILGGLGYERPRIKIPAAVVMPIAHLVEVTYRLLGPYGMKVPQLTPSRVRLLSCGRTFNASKAKNLLGYTPIVPLQEGIKRTIESYADLRAENQPKREGPSKASIYLGNGRGPSLSSGKSAMFSTKLEQSLVPMRKFSGFAAVADTLLWKDKKMSITTLLVLAAIYYTFIASKTTLITALAKTLLVAVVFLFVHGSLPEKILGYRIEKIPSSSFYLSEEQSRRVASSVASSWNGFVKIMESLYDGNDWIHFLKITGSLLVISIVGLISLQQLFLIGVPVAFLGFLLYEKKEQEIDSFVLNALSFVGKQKSDIERKFLKVKKID
ncbi:hypothetical protein MLD38_014219 [Melastoma candidum]|uniref:Uncharacterized protein n=1 Tax=Melastoma candidum TaxID=119954 RepID=A0ACB9RFS3_9MYRT|nr:hypothetical protein MLD38_014219 [Melastoma candidum]